MLPELSCPHNSEHVAIFYLSITNFLGNKLLRPFKVMKDNEENMYLAIFICKMQNCLKGRAQILPSLCQRNSK